MNPYLDQVIDWQLKSPSAELLTPQTSDHSPLTSRIVSAIDKQTKKLKRRERQIAQLYLVGYTQKEIAWEMRMNGDPVSQATVSRVIKKVRLG